MTHKTGITGRSKAATCGPAANDTAVVQDKQQPAVERTARPVGRPRKYETPEQMQAVIDRYFLTTDKPTICGLALELGFLSRQSLYDYQGYGLEFDYVLKRASLRVECHYEKMLLHPGGNPRAVIFALKRFGWRDNPPPTHEDSPPIDPPVVHVTAGAEGSPAA